MTALSANRNTKNLASLGNWPAEMTVYNDAVLYAGAMLCIDATPEVRPAADTSGFKVVGRCPYKIDNADDGLKVNPELGIFLWANDVTNPVLVGDVICYVHDDQTVCASAGVSNNVVAGLVVEVVSGVGVWVDQTEVALKVGRAIYASGLYTQQAHVADVAGVTQDSLTDNGGGTADATVASQAAPTTLTDSSGLSGTHDDTVAAMTNTDDLTDNGGGTADGTVASQAAPVTLTDNTGGAGAHDDTLAAITTPTNVTDNSGGATGDTTLAALNGVDGSGSNAAPLTATKDGLAKLAVLANAAGTAIGVLKQNQSDAAQKIIELVTLAGAAQNNLKEVTTELGKQRTANGVLAQNQSDIAQKIIEIVTLLGTAQNNLKEVTTELAKIRTDNGAQVTKINAILAALESAGVVASS